MNNIYINEYIDHFEKVLSAAYQNNYSLDAVTRAISYSSYFQKIEKDKDNFAPIIDDVTLIKSMFPDLDIDLEKLKTYKQSLWVAECYLKIQEYSGLTFEAIFMYISINEMYRYFDIYHEMDFSQILDRFNELFKKQSVMSILIDKYGYSLNYIAEQTGISYETLFSLKSRRRDIKKVNAYTIIRLSAFLNVRVETLSEIQFL